ncbi:MAG: cell division protein FtsL [Lachnospiraceae bacterium]|nr:cell division protein FtsL [Lachnospiraceae bacterium]
MAAQAVRKQNAAREYDEERLRVIEGHRKRKRANTFRCGLFLTVAVTVLAVMVGYYLSLQSQITNYIKDIAKQESRLNELRLDNDENYSRITSNVDLENVRKIAIQELGMRYALEGQIISFNGEDSDYLRQTGKIPEQ